MNKLVQNFVKSAKIDIDREMSNFIKGLSIFIIASHNYWHNIQPAFGENEFDFNEIRFWKLIECVMAYPVESFHFLFSYYGFYPVYLFLFVSGYGMTKKYATGTPFAGGLLTLYSWRDGIFRQIRKIIKLCVVGMLVTLLLRYAQGININFKTLKDFLLFLTFTNNLRPGALNDCVSVWWYLSLAVQMYLLFPLLLICVRRRPLVTLVASLMLVILCGIFNGYVARKFNIYLFATPISQSVVFIFGIYVALYKRVPFLFIVPCAICFIFGGVNQYIHALSYVSFVVVVVLLLNYKKSFSKGVCWLGAMSMFFYISHGDVKVLLVSVANGAHSLYVGTAIYLGYMIMILFVGLLTAFAFTMPKRVVSFWRKKVLHS